MSDEYRQHLLKGLSQDIRLDGRKKDQYRDITIEYNVVANAEGSAKVSIGGTTVIAGVKMALETPYGDTPDQGNFMVNVELLPLSNPDFEVGPPNEESIELARVTDRGIRESKAIDSKKLCVKKGEKVWSVTVDICPINDAGNLFDACSIAALAAIKDAKFPKVKEEDGHMSVDYHSKTSVAVPMSKQPIGVTVWKIGDNYLVDPVLAEQHAYDARLTVTSTDDGTICALQKGGSAALTVDDIEAMVELALSKSREISKYF